MRSLIRGAICALTVGSLSAAPLADAAAAGPGGSVQGIKPSLIGAVSSDGRTAVIVRDEGYPENYPPYNDGYIRDLACGTTVRIPRSGTTGATPRVWASGFDDRVAMTPNGRWIAFSAWLNWPAFELAVHDRWTGALVVASAGLGDRRYGNPALSGDGRYVAFDDSDGRVHLRDLWSSTVVRVDRAWNGGTADRWSFTPSVSGNGRFVAFGSASTNLVPGDTNDAADIFVRDLWAGVTTRVSVGAAGAQADGASDAFPALSADGRYVGFVSAAANLVPGDTNGVEDVFVHDRWTGNTRRVSVDGAGRQGNGGSFEFSLSADGRTVAFASAADNLVAGDSNGVADVFVTVVGSRAVRRASLSRSGTQLPLSSGRPVLAANGRQLGFTTAAAAVPEDTNALSDGYLRDLATRSLVRATLYAT